MGLTMKILKAILAPYYFLTSPASYAEAGEPEIEDPRVAECVRQAKWQLLHSDLTLIEVGAETYNYLLLVLERGPGPLAVLGVPIQPMDWKDRVKQPGAVWKTAKGTTIHVEFMANSHLKHTVAYLERCGQKHTPKYGLVKCELNRRAKQGLDVRPIKPYDCVDEIDDADLGDNLKTMGYRKYKFAGPAQERFHTLVSEIYDDTDDEEFYH
tara:strand:- start:5301 stop:5933 length:633 start_codon:yes stop_codon:yes gene_type:complete